MDRRGRSLESVSASFAGKATVTEDMLEKVVVGDSGRDEDRWCYLPRNSEARAEMVIQREDEPTSFQSLKVRNPSDTRSQ